MYGYVCVSGTKHEIATHTCLSHGRAVKEKHFVHHAFEVVRIATETTIDHP